ncbi:unnamed protein product [Rotaria sordida]|uniref:Uncharacterized protein n=1 Tax=Rotaria sordida TaxID=392033 RepID=A0A814YAK7_9BILA|nr:unnamed protein product [Rotaria sordida]CAF1509132.1 unnamed protein product [Rotaria sordida]
MVRRSTTTVTTTITTVATNSAYYCNGISSFTLWQLYSPNGLFMDIDTTSCRFNSTPLYFTSMAGTSSHWDLAGYTAIYSPTNTSFRIYTRSLNTMNSTEMLSYSQTYIWNVNWFGISY